MSSLVDSDFVTTVVGIHLPRFEFSLNGTIEHVGIIFVFQFRMDYFFHQYG